VAERSSAADGIPDVLGPGRRSSWFNCCAAREVCTFVRTFIRGVRIIKIPALSRTTENHEFRAVSPYKVVITFVIFRAPDNATVLTINLPPGGNDDAIIFMTRVMHGVHMII